MEIPDYLVNQVLQGKVVLLLGSGASKGAIDANGNEPPAAEQLARMLSQEFLGGAYADAPLSTVSELAVAASSLISVQNFIRSRFADFRPADFHVLLSTFRWRGLATTNYDLIIEAAYSATHSRAQDLVPFRSNLDQVDDLLRSPRALPYLKLHGCISRADDQEAPLILTPDQYVLYRKNRDRLFNMLTEWAHEHPIVFVGQALHDSDIRQLLLELSSLGGYRPRFYLVKPSVSQVEVQLWESKQITPLAGSFEDFLRSLDSKLPSLVRGAITIERGLHPIETRFVSKTKMTESTLNFVSYEADFVHPGMAIEHYPPKVFYKGTSTGWSAIDQKFDVRRNVIDEILTDVFVIDEGERPTPVDFYVIEGEAGAGKSVCLRRIAWEAAAELGRLCIFLKPHARLRYEAILELFELSRERLFLFVDNAADHVAEIETALSCARRDEIPLTLMTAERVNEWNMTAERIDGLVTKAYPIARLSRSEIEKLVYLLEKHRSLGYLESASPEARISAFEDVADRQLLVALYEVTQGRPFEEILVDEFNEIRPLSAQSLYLTVCVLNRLRVPVRAGLISRIHGIPFSDFRDRLFKPLEYVVMVFEDTVLKDHLYIARHPLIAEVVFERILTDPEDRFREYIRILDSLNIAFKTDRDAYRRLVRGRVLLGLFPSHEMVEAIFRNSEELARDDPYLYHQHGTYELNRPDGNLNIAFEHFTRAKEMSRGNVTIVHSLAELELERAERAHTVLEREHYREQATKLANAVRNDPISGSYGYHTLLKIGLGRLRDLLSDAASSSQEIERALREVEGLLELGLQKFPDDEFILSAEADLGRLVRDHDRVIYALESAFRADPRSTFIANRLAKAYKAGGDRQNALATLNKAVEENPGDKQLHFSLALMLTEDVPLDRNQILHHLRRSFTKGDQNHEAQFWYAVFSFESGDRERLLESKDIFRNLRALPMPRQLRTRARRIWSDESGTALSFVGRIAKKEASYGFLEREGAGDWIYMRRENVSAELWKDLKVGDRVIFAIGFDYGGPTVVEVARIQ